MWLLDKNVPIQLERLLQEFGVAAATADSRGFGGLANGELVASANAIGVTCILTRDLLFAQSAKKSLRLHGDVCVVLLTLPQMRAPGFLQAFRESWSRAPIRPVPGQTISWPS
jgi:predicted nuclease of predicted toxin-antitoxin system